MVRLRSPRTRLAILALLLVGGSLVVVLTTGPSGPEIRRAVQRTGVAAPLVYLAVYVVLTVLLFPGALLTASGGALFGVPLGTALSVLSATIGAGLAFAAGRRLGRRQVELITGARLDAVDRWVGRHGFVAILYLRLLPIVPFNAFNYVAGLTAVETRQYILATAIGIVPGTFAFTALGGDFRHPGSVSFLAAVALIILLAVGGPVIDRCRRRGERSLERDGTMTSSGVMPATRIERMLSRLHLPIIRPLKEKSMSPISDVLRRLTGSRRPAAGERLRAVWNGTLLAESDDTVVMEGNHYFPAESLRREHFAPSEKTTVCPWKGTASYYDVFVDGSRNPGAAWYYPEPKPAAAQLTNRVAFWRGVRVEPVGAG